jgi:deazaflavin-dependent oxidoreductase (nitroreductase family)
MARTYLKPPWFMRVVGNRLAPVFGRRIVATLSVPGRVTGQVRTTPIVVLEHDGERYLVAPYGDTDWTLNLRTAGRGQLHQQGATEDIAVDEVPPDQRPPLIAAYEQRYGKAPRVRASFEQLPDPADHPTFRIAPAPDTSASPDSP